MSLQETANDIILVENGDMFEGTRDQFRNSFFDNASDNEIKDWCQTYGYSLTINGKNRMEYKSRNGLRMLECKPLCFQIQHIYRDNTGPLVYCISVHNDGDFWYCNYYPEEGHVSFAGGHYSDDGVFIFKVDSFEEASVMIKKFADGMGCKLEGTIYIKDDE